jgi:tRNA dimethylallyltransferase
MVAKQTLTENTVFVLAGPTAVGKTAIAIHLARQLGTTIISADSRQCYHNMHIGTAAPTIAEQQGVKHYFVDAFPVTAQLTAADFEAHALGYLDEIFKQNKIAIICGGTGLYIKALCEGLDEMPEINPAIAEEVNQDYQMQGLQWLQQAVHAEDPDFYAQAEVQNPARLLRALIFKRSTGDSIIHFRTGTKKQRPFRVIKACLDLPRELLYDRINERVNNMMQQGLLEEVNTLYPYRHLKNLQTVGYAELFDHIDGKYDLLTAVEKIKQNSRNYAKRQLTWFRRDKEMQWLRADDTDIANQLLALI